MYNIIKVDITYIVCNYLDGYSGIIGLLLIINYIMLLKLLKFSL